jgi:3-deoxy-D-manno-octulosonic-acid transferase
MTSPALVIYAALARLAGPAIRVLLNDRLQRGKEEAERIPERIGLAGAPRPDGPLLWLHAASVGESQSALVLLGRLLDTRPGLSVLVTTGTVTSARLLATRLPPRCVHQFVPADCPRWVGRFLDHWRPDAAIWMESELWPNLIRTTAARGIPAALVNARMSDRSFANWRRVPGMVRALLGCFDTCLAQSEEQAARLRALGAEHAVSTGNLKFSAAPLAADPDALQRLKENLAGRMVWLAASTHAGEETLAAQVHARLKPHHPGLLTIIAPRHPDRAEDIAQIIAAHELTAVRRSSGQAIGPADDIYLADTMGELGLFYRLAPVSYVGGGIAQLGGHNPLEPAQLGSAVLHGPDMANFRTVAEAFAEAGAAIECADVDDMTRAVDRLLSDETARKAQAEAARRITEANRDVVETVVARLTPLLDRTGAEARQ